MSLRNLASIVALRDNSVLGRIEVTTLDKVIGKLSFVGSLLTAVALLAMFLFMFTEVVGRYFFNHPFGYSVDVAELMLLVIFYLPLATVLRAEEHIKVDLVTSQSPHF